VTKRAAGTFEVKLVPQASASESDPALGRMTIAKQYQGELDATGAGQMLTGMSSVKGSAGYVAIEKVSGTLDGKRGSFVLQHSGTMDRGAPRLSITVVPDSGSGELTGITGTMAIIIAGGQHSYEFDYSLGGGG
jgi:hypothetical protein